MMAWIMANLPMIASVLAAVLAVDVALASTDLFKSNNAIQAVLAGIKTVVEFLLGLVTPKSGL